MRAGPGRYAAGGDRPPDSLSQTASREEHAVSDTALQRAVMEALAHNPHVRADEIAVETLDGSGGIALRGTVGGLVQHVEALRTAGRVPGVRHVEDGLRIRPMGIDGRADADTGAAVLDALGAD